MYSKKTTLLMGFHGCDRSVCDSVINGDSLKPSLNSYDWLGNGIYFWEADPQRAMEWAVQASKRKSSSVKDPAVLGAVIDLGNCFDLMNRQSIPILESGYKWLKEIQEAKNLPLPENRNVKGNYDFLYRDLDCAVIQKVHEATYKRPDLGIAPYDSVRGLFLEGSQVYEGSSFKEKTHVQLCIINPNCIKGYFLPRELDRCYPVP